MVRAYFDAWQMKDQGIRLSLGQFENSAERLIQTLDVLIADTLTAVECDRLLTWVKNRAELSKGIVRHRGELATMVVREDAPQPDLFGGA